MKHRTLMTYDQWQHRFKTALTNYMNKISTSEGLLYQIYNLNPALHEDDEFMDCLKRMKEYVKL